MEGGAFLTLRAYFCIFITSDKYLKLLSNGRTTISGGREVDMHYTVFEVRSPAETKPKEFIVCLIVGNLNIRTLSTAWPPFMPGNARRGRFLLVCLSSLG